MAENLNEKQKRFADFYIETGNAYQAAIKSGYSDTYAKGNVVKLLENVRVKKYIDSRLKQMESDRIASAAEVMKYLTSVMRNELTEEVVVVEGEGEGVSSARKIKKDMSAKDRNKAAELLGKRYGMFTDKLSVDGEVSVQIVDDVND